MKKSLYSLLSASLLFTACQKKELPPETDNEAVAPVFYTKATINGTELDLSAGSDNYYMTSSYYQDTQNLYVYEADLKQKSCTSGCGYAITLLINDAQISAPGAAMNVDGALKVSSYKYDSKNPAPISYMAKFTPVDAITASAAYKWEFSDGVKLNGYEVTRTMDANTVYSAKYIFSSPCDASHTNFFNVGNPLQTKVVATRNAALPDVLNYQFTANPTDQGALKYVWNFGDNSATSTETAPNHTYDRTGKYTTTLQLIDAKGDTCMSYYQVAAYFDKNCSANFTVAFEPVKVPILFSGVTVLVTDPNGVVYSSKEIDQPLASNFEIVSVEDYKANDAGQATKKIKVKFNCTLKNNSNQLVINNAEAVIAVSFK